jgi:hypothetical protein
MSTRVYTYVKDTDYSQISIIDDTNTPITYDLIYNSNKLTTVKDTSTEPMEKIISFSRDVNDEVQKIIDHKNKQHYTVKQADNSQYNEFWKRPDNYTKISEYNIAKKINYIYTPDKSLPEVNRTPISILREIGFDSISCSGTQSLITNIQTHDTTIQIVPYYYDGKIQSVLGTNTNTPAEQWKVTFIYVDNKLDRMEEYTYRADALGRLKYIIDATFTFKYVIDKLSYILCTGTPYKRIDIQYNSIGELVAVYKITNVKSLWFKTMPNGIEYQDKSKTLYKLNKPQLITMVNMVIDNVPAKLNFNYDVTKGNVNRFIMPGIIAPDGSILNLCKFNVDMNGEQTHIASFDLEYNNIMYYKLIPSYRYGKVKSVDILDYPSLTKLGTIRYFYNKNKINQIITYYNDKNDVSVWFSSFSYSRNPYNPKDRTLKIEHDYAGTGDDKLGKWTFKLSDNMQVNDIFDHFGKIKVSEITYNNMNEPITCNTLVDSPMATDIDNYKLSEFFAIIKGGVL